MKSIVLLAGVSIITAAATVSAVRTVRPPAVQPAPRTAPAFNCEAQVEPMLFIALAVVSPRVCLPFLPLMSVPLEIDSSTSGEVPPGHVWDHYFSPP